MKPIIGITSYYIDSSKDEISRKRFMSSRIYVSYLFYADKVEKAGGVPLNIPVLLGDSSVARLAERLDGILFCGGEDIAPSFYGEKSNGSEPPVPERDNVEMKLFKAFYDAQKPILGICRGEQLMNVFFGGTLIQDIPSMGGSHLEHVRRDSPNAPVHKVAFEAGSLAESLWGKELEVNSLHHQAADKVGKGLTATGASEDGLIEVLERPGYPAFMMGVQWHPERLTGGVHDKVFEMLVQSAAKA